jgi:hypothetical protein
MYRLRAVYTVAIVAAACSGTVHALDVNVAVLSRYPYYAAHVVINDVPPGTEVVKTYVPLHLQHGRVTFAPGGAGSSSKVCIPRTRAPFGGVVAELAAVDCVPAADGDTYAFTLNGTAAYLPVRFPVVACRSVEGDANTSSWMACQSNALTWALLSPFDRVAACELVGIFAFGFWVLTICFVCICCLRYTTWRHPYVPVTGRIDVRAADLEASTPDDDDDDDDTDTGDDDAEIRPLTKQAPLEVEAGRHSPPHRPSRATKKARTERRHHA